MNKKRKSAVRFVILSLISLFVILFSVNIVSAEILFVDDFSGPTLDFSKWSSFNTVDRDGNIFGVVQVLNGKLFIQAGSTSLGRAFGKLDTGVGAIQPFSGDFDALIDFSEFKRTSAAGAPSGSLIFFLQGTDFDSEFYSVEFLTNNPDSLSTGPEFVSSKFSRLDEFGNSFIGEQRAPYTANSGQIKIKREGTQVTAFYRTGETAPWTQLSSNPWITGSVRVRLIAQSNSNTMEGKFDNLMISKPALPLPPGIDSVTGTVSATGGTNLGDTITVSGGVSGGTVIVEDINKVNTVDITVPANTMTTLKIFPDGMPTIVRTDASFTFPIELQNLKTVTSSVKVQEPDGRYTADAKIQPGEKVQVFRHADRPEITVRAHPTNIGVVPVTIIPSGVFSPITESIVFELLPSEDVRFGSELTPSAHSVLQIGTESGLTSSIKLLAGDRSLADLRLPATGDFDFLYDDLREFGIVTPNSEGIVIGLLASDGTTCNPSCNAAEECIGGKCKPLKSFYEVKARELKTGKISVAAPANYKLDVNRDGILDIEYKSKLGNAFYSKFTGSGYDQLSATGANGINMVVISSTVNPDPLLTVAYKGVSQTKDLGKSQAINFIIQKDKFGNSVTVAGNSRTITGSLIEEISPAAIIEGWNYWYTATDNDYWQWSVILESLPTGCTADKTTASTTVANSVQTLAFNVDCGTTSTTTGAVVSGMAVTGADRGFATKGKATLLSEFSDCTKLLPNGQHKCAPTQQFREEVAQVVKGVMNPTGSAVLGLKGSNGLPILISLLTLAGVIALIAIQVRRKTVDW